jgi:hypothetical protein
MKTKSGNEFMVAFGFGSVGIAINPPDLSDGLSPINYIELTADEAIYLAELLVMNANFVRVIKKKKN